jgi:oligoribonuclease NrnB/cAMP/cGMP phosphodiesterase (DHH superfamily)
VGKETWSRIESAVAAIETEPLTEEKKDGDKVKKVHRPGWYDTITLLAQARRADQREGDYEQHGLKPWLDLGRWRKQQPGDAEADVFSARQFGEVMLPRLRKQAEFFEIGDENGLVARDIAAAAQADIHRAVDTWLTEADEYWQRQFTSSLPAPARTLAQVRTRLDELKGIRPSLLMSTMKNIQGAFSGLKKLTDDPKSDVVLAASEERRKQLYDKWSVCFDIQDLSVYTIHRAIADLSDFSQAIDLVVSSLGTDTAQARARVAKISKGGTNVLSQASEVANRLDAGAAADSPRSALAKQVRAITDAAWSGLLEAAEKNVNDRWSNVRVTLSGGGSFKAAFGAGGPFDTFKKEYLSDLFNEDDLQTRARILGQTLAITTEMRQTLNQVKKLRNGLFDSSGSYRSDHVALDLQLGGAANPESLVVEYQPKEGQTQTSQKYVNGRPITFQFDWSPLTCKEFRFTVGFVNSEPKTHKWTGPWAVADALRAARQESNAYVWPAKEGEWKNDAGQPYEVKLTLLPDSTTALLEFYPGGGDKSPIDALIQSLPAKAVKVEK